MQNLLVALIVIACTGYAVWVLIPGTLRRAAAQQALKLRWPAPIATRLQKAAKVSGGCGCDGCDAKPLKPTDAGQPIRIHRRPNT